jgi:hypothetical protein
MQSMILTIDRKGIQNISSLKMFVKKGNITNYKLGCHI